MAANHKSEIALLDDFAVLVDKLDCLPYDTAIGLAGWAAVGDMQAGVDCVAQADGADESPFDAEKGDNLGFVDDAAICQPVDKG